MVLKQVKDEPSWSDQDVFGVRESQALGKRAGKLLPSLAVIPPK